MRRTATIVLVVLLGTLAQAASAQRNVVRLPYDGCVEDLALRPPSWRGGDRTPLRCTTSYFSKAQFDSLAYFSFAQFASRADFYVAQFDSRADFYGAHFDSLAYFREAHFDSQAYFNVAQFASRAYFRFAHFDSLAYFNYAHFDSLAYFRNAFFHSLADFRSAQFASLADFSFAQFYSRANFSEAQFASRADFSRAQFDSRADFSRALFWGPVDFRGARFDSSAPASFARTTVRDTLFVGIQGLDDIQRFDFRRVQFLSAGRDVRISPSFGLISVRGDTVEVRYPGAAVVLSGLVELQMQQAKFNFLHLADDLSYFDKEDIITNLKEKSYAREDQSNERFELDYLLARSTMHQKKIGTHERYAWYHYRLWLNYGYYGLMGFGYRPFQIFLWAALMIVGFAFYYRRKMPRRIYDFVQGEEGKPAQPPESPQEPSSPSPAWTGVERTIGRPRPSQAETQASQAEQTKSRKQNIHSAPNPWIHCLYFSVMVFFTFRLKQKILTFFDTRERRIIVTQWTLGFLVYIAFLTLSKSGSILQQLKTLFIG